MRYVVFGVWDFTKLFATISVFAVCATAGTEKVLYSFHGPGDGSLPTSNLLLDNAGNLYGTTSAGGSASCMNQYGIFGCGTVFELSPSPSGVWIETVLYSFQGGADGLGPGNIVFDNAGNIYGTTWGGGIETCYSGCGTVFKLSRKQGRWTESILYRFQGGADGYAPIGVILDSSGVIYGVTYHGGDTSCSYTKFGCGVLFKLSESSSGTWTETVLHTFGVTAGDGLNPNGGLVFDRQGNLYGSTQTGGTAPVASGTIFEFMPGSSWSESILYSFDGGSPGGSVPMGGVIFGRGGRLYGSTYNGGIYGWGTFYEAKSGTNGWSESAIQPLGGYTDSGLTPVGQLATDASGNLYGTTESGGIGRASSGTVYKMTPTAQGGWTGTIIYAFSGRADGGVPQASVVVDGAGNVFGSTEVGGVGNCDPYWGAGCGVIFEITP
jgi:hypothetical protein